MENSARRSLCIFQFIFRRFRVFLNNLIKIFVPASFIKDNNFCGSSNEWGDFKDGAQGKGAPASFVYFSIKFLLKNA